MPTCEIVSLLFPFLRAKVGPAELNNRIRSDNPGRLLSVHVSSRYEHQGYCNLPPSKTVEVNFSHNGDAAQSSVSCDTTTGRLGHRIQLCRFGSSRLHLVKELATSAMKRLAFEISTSRILIVLS